MDKPPPVSALSQYNWTSPHLLDHQVYADAVEKAVDLLLKDKNHPVDSTISKAIQALFYLFAGILSSSDITIKPFCITIDSELSMGAGTGSSASISVACMCLLQLGGYVLFDWIFSCCSIHSIFKTQNSASS